MDNENIKLVSEEEAEILINNHDSYVSKMPICYDEDLERYKYTKVELWNGNSELRHGRGSLINVFKYEHKERNKQAFDSKLNKDGSISIYSTYRDEFGETVTVDNRIDYKRAIEIVFQLQICINNLDKKNRK